MIKNFANLKSRRGFTLVELLLSMALIGVVAFFSVPVYQSSQVKNDLDIAALESAQSMRRAMMLSQGMDADDSWGVKAQSGSLVVFKGASYGARDMAYDEVFDLPGSIVASGVTEFVFSKFTGWPTPAGTLTLTSSNGDVKNIILNDFGMVEY